MEEYSSGSCSMDSQILKTEPEEVYIKEENYIPEFDQNVRLQDTLSSTNNDKSESNDSDTENEIQFKIVIDDNNKKLYECGICKRLLRERSFKKHYALHSGEFPYQCMMCRWKALNRNTIATHMLSKHQILVDPQEIRKIVPKIEQTDPRYTIVLGKGNRKLYECAVCKRQLALKRGFQNHYMIHTGYYPYACTICGRKTRDTFLMVRHMLIQHRMVVRSSDIVKCDNGNGKDNQGTDRNHFGKKVCKVLHCGNRKFYKCTLCNTRLNTMKRFNEHFRIHSHLKNKSQLVINESKYKKAQVLCKICGEDIPKHTFKKHMINHSTASKTYYCGICRWKSKTKNLLDCHFQKEHQKDLSINGKKTDIKQVQHYICKFCNVPFSHWGLFKQHMRIHSCIKKFKRSGCNNPTAKEGELREHVNENESTGTQPKLEILFVDANVKDHLKEEPVKRKSKKDKRTRFNCKFCPFTASTKSPYRTHLKIHRIDGNNAKGCYAAGQKEEEMESVHYTAILDGEVRAYKCTICGKTTKERYLIRRHVWVHTGQFPMTCVLCKAKIRLKKSMKFHLKKEHRLDVRIRDIESDGKLKGDIKEYQRKSAENNQLKIKLEKSDTGTVVAECLNPIKVKLSESNGPTSTDNTKNLPTGDDRYITVKNGRFFQCVICHKNWKTKGGFNAHFARHTGKLPYSCEICGHKGGTKKIIKNHMRRAHKVHISTHDIPDMVSEPESEGEDDTTNSMMEIVGIPYTTIENNSAVLVKCKVCNRILDNKHQFGWHFKGHKKEFPFSCDICPYRSRDESYLKSHMETCHPKDMRFSNHSNGSKVHPSAGNGMTARSLRLQESTKSSPHGIVEIEGDGCILIEKGNNVIYKCLLCEKEVKNRYIFNLHFVIHKGELPYSCKQCPYRTKEKSYLKEHLEIRHNVEIELENIEEDNFDNNESSRYLVVRSGSRRLLKCRICGDLKTRRHHFNKHYLLHTQEALYSCNSCDYKATEKRFLKQHLQIKHNIIVETKDILLDGEMAIDPLRTEKFPCILCGKNFNTQYQFNKHNLIHSDDRPYVCPHCTYKSKSKYLLKTHLFRRHKIRLGVADIHPTKTPVDSKVIVKQEFQVTDPNTIQTQASSKMLKCESCHFTCSVSSTLTKHRKRAHNIGGLNYTLTRIGTQRNYKCAVCGKVYRTRPIFDEHFTAHIEELPYSCPLCHFRTANSSEVGKHIEDFHKGIQRSLGNEVVPVINQKNYKCEQSPYIPLTKQEFLEHEESHLVDDKSSINGCTLDTPEYVTVKEELPDNYNDVFLKFPTYVRKCFHDDRS